MAILAGLVFLTSAVCCFSGEGRIMETSNTLLDERGNQALKREGTPNHLKLIGVSNG